MGRSVPVGGVRRLARPRGGRTGRECTLLTLVGSRGNPLREPLVEGGQRQQTFAFVETKMRWPLEGQVIADMRDAVAVLRQGQYFRRFDQIVRADLSEDRPRREVRLTPFLLGKPSDQLESAHHHAPSS